MVPAYNEAGALAGTGLMLVSGDKSRHDALLPDLGERRRLTQVARDLQDLEQTLPGADIAAHHRGAGAPVGGQPQRTVRPRGVERAQFVGPLGEMAGGIDISLPVTLGLASVVYLSLLRLFPEPAAVYGPTDPRSERTDVRAEPALQKAA